MVVVGEAHSGCFRLCAGLVERIGVPLPVVQCLAFVFRNPGDGGPVMADSFSIVELFLPTALQRLEWQMGRWGTESIPPQQLTDLDGSSTKIAGELDFLVADRGNFGERARKVGLHQISNGVELKPNSFQLSARRQNLARGHSLSARDSEGSDSERCDKVATGLHCKRTVVRFQLVWRSWARYAIKLRTFSQPWVIPPKWFPLSRDRPSDAPE